MIQLYKEIKDRIKIIKKISSTKLRLLEIKKGDSYEESKKETMKLYKTVLQVKRQERLRLTQENFLLSYISNHNISTEEEMTIFYDQSLQIMQAINTHFTHSN
jgi:hypothetical protein